MQYLNCFYWEKEFRYKKWHLSQCLELAVHTEPCPLDWLVSESAPNPVFLVCNSCFSLGESSSSPPVHSCAASVPELLLNPWIVMDMVGFAARLLHVCGFCIAVVVCCAVQTHPPESDSHCSRVIWKSCSVVLRDSYTGGTKLFPAKTAHGSKGPVGEHKLGQHSGKSGLSSGPWWSVSDQGILVVGTLQTQQRPVSVIFNSLLDADSWEEAQRQSLVGVGYSKSTTNVSEYQSISLFVWPLLFLLQVSWMYW